MVVLFLVFIMVAVLTDYGILKTATPKGRIIGVYALLMAASAFLGVLIIIGKRPASPADIIEGIIHGLGVGK